jgi:hypothetical protein
MRYGRAGADILYPGHSSYHARYFAAGLVLRNVSPDDGDSFSRPYWTAGVGQRWSVGERTWMRA